MYNKFHKLHKPLSSAHCAYQHTSNFMEKKCVSKTPGLYRVAHKKRPKFAMILYCSTIDIKQKEITYLKSNRSWTVRAIIIPLYAFVLTVKYAKEYWVSETCKTNVSETIRRPPLVEV